MSGHDSPTQAEATHTSPPLWSERRVRWLCTVMGAWGVATGFAVFVLLWTHGRPHPLTFIAGLLVAALIAYIAELLRDVIKEGIAIPAITGPRVVVTVLLLMIIELVVHAGTTLVQLTGDGHEATATHTELQEILAPLGGEDSSVMLEVIGLTIAWMVVGAVVARRLSRIIFLQLRGNRIGILRGAREGVLGGLIAAPLCALGCQLAVRAYFVLSDAVQRGDAWRQDTRSSLHHHLLSAPAYLWIKIYDVVQWGHGAGGVILAMAITWGAMWAWDHRSSPRIRVGALVLLLVLIAPLPTDAKRLFHLALLAIIIWVVPGFMLGMAAPLLRGAGDEPRWWGIIAFVAAALLCLITWLKLTNPGCYALALGLMLIGLVFFRGAPLRDYWPLAAAAMASMMSGVMVVVEKATFLGVVAEAHEIYRLPLLRPDPLLASMQALVDSLQHENVFDQEDLRLLARRVREIASLRPDRQVERLPEIKEMIGQIQQWTRGAEAGKLREIAEGRMWGVFSPGDDVADLYLTLARLADHPPTANHREAAYGRLSATTDELIEDFQERVAKAWRGRMQVTNELSEMEAALKSGTASEDTARFGPALGSLVADLYQFSKTPREQPDRQGFSLTNRLRIMMHDINMAVPDDVEDSIARFNVGPHEATPLEDRLKVLWEQLRREIESPGSGGFTAPKPFAGDPKTLAWQESVESEHPAETKIPKLHTRLDWLHMVRNAIEHQRAALAQEQEPLPLLPAGESSHHEAHPEQQNPPGVLTAKKTESQKPAPPSTGRANAVLAATFPSAARLDRLAEIRQQLVEVQASAEKMKQWWSAPPAVTLELSLIGSFGFWVTVALLAAWSVTEPRKHGEAHT